MAALTTGRPCSALMPVGAGVGSTLTGVGPASGVPARSNRRSITVVAAPSALGALHTTTKLPN